MIKLINLLENRKYEYGCVMLYFDFPEINQIHNKIQTEDIFTDPEDPSFGLEEKPHVTLLFGLHPVSLIDIKETLNSFTFSTCKIYNMSSFKNEKYDVLKFDVKGENLHKANDALKQFPYTSNFPNYHPHLTIGYLQPGTSNKYIKEYRDKEFELVPKYAVYSTAGGDEHKIKISID